MHLLWLQLTRNSLLHGFITFYYVIMSIGYGNSRANSSCSCCLLCTESCLVAHLLYIFLRPQFHLIYCCLLYCLLQVHVSRLYCTCNNGAHGGLSCFLPATCLCLLHVVGTFNYSHYAFLFISRATRWLPVAIWNLRG